MPFTAAHPLAILPFRRWLDPTTLAIGAMSPDFMYFARGELAGNYGHTLPGIAIWCVPITLACALLFHELVKWPLLLAAPRALAARLVAAAREPWPRGLALLIPSAVLGAVTHVIWDGFTHGRGWAVRRLEPLQATLVLPVYRIIQHASTLLGLAILAVVLVRWFRRQPSTPLPDVPRATARWVLAICVALGIAALYARAAVRHTFSAGDIVVAPISGTLAALIVAGILLRGRARQLH